jgi:exodeoxyribonuclease V beta subunit
MTSSWFGLTGNQLYAIWQDEALLDGWFNRFLLYYQLWQDRGLLAMMNRLLMAEKVTITLADGAMAERRIANIHHLLELIQEAESTEKLGPGQTLVWLRSMIAGNSGTEDRELRLESDEQAVRIVTMHSAKGLQYPVVFCPYLWYRSGRLGQEKQLVSCHDQENNLIVDLGSPDFTERRKKAQEEELAEDLRLLYVALTRAELRCYVMWAQVKNTGQVAASLDSAPGYLLFPDSSDDFEEQHLLLAGLAKNPGIEHRILQTGEQFPATWSPKAEKAVELSALSPGKRSLHTDYQMSSYSAMASLSEHEDHGAAAPAEVEEEPQGETVARILYPGLPAGAGFGNLIHDSLEQLSFPSLAAKEDNSREIARLCKRYGISLEAQTVRDLLATIVTTPLIGQSGFSLAGLAEGRCVKEMPFYFHMSRMETATINTILADEPTVVPLSHKVMQGYLTGFVDLVCEHDGMYYILDYKTNYLGERAGDYSGGNLVQAMAAHNYGLQYWIYTLVLHRHLQNVLPGYSYARHFGGVMYLFIRGMRVDSPGSGVFRALPSAGLLARLDRAVGGGR